MSRLRWWCAPATWSQRPPKSKDSYKNTYMHLCFEFFLKPVFAYTTWSEQTKDSETTDARIKSRRNFRWKSTKPDGKLSLLDFPNCHIGNRNSSNLWTLIYRKDFTNHSRNLGSLIPKVSRSDLLCKVEIRLRFDHR